MEYEIPATAESVPPAGSPFHEGERMVQTRLGVRDEIEPWARRVVRSELPAQHREFYGQLPFLVLAARDAAEKPWVTLLAGEPGFAASPHPSALEIAALPSRDDALAGSLHPGNDFGILGIELSTRRRNRVNGRIAGQRAGGLGLKVEQTFGNCPQYITGRQWRRAPANEGPGQTVRSTALSVGQREWIERADTFFISTGFRGEGDSPTFGMDASHRGGAPGFVRVEGPGLLVFPDYAGNNHYNTLGNLEMDPRAGLLFVDFEQGHLLQLSGRATVDWDPGTAEAFPGARRLVRFEIEAVVGLERVLPIRFETGRESVRELRLISKRQESADVRSFLLEARDGGPLPQHVPGQHLPIELNVPGQTSTLNRTYSLSNGPEKSQYRITVKREPHGVASRFLHDGLEPGAFVSASVPAGDFTLEASGKRPIILVSAGIGLTPLVSMLHALANDTSEEDRPVWFVHGARDGLHHPLRSEVEELIDASHRARRHVVYSQPRPEDVLGRDHQSVGRVDGALLEGLVPGLDAEFYLCGPLGFMAAVQAQLEERGVPADRIRTESFGPAS